MIKRRNLGRSDLSVSEIALGTMYFGWREPREESIARLDSYFSLGGNFIDTANVYTRREAEGLDLYGKDIDKFSDGASERLIGAWMKEKKNREEIVLATKVGFAYPGIEIGTSKKQIKEECEKSLKRLGTDYIDLYYLHLDDKNTPLSESLSAMDELVREGKIRYIGLSNFTPERLREAVFLSEEMGLSKICCIQNKGTYLKPRADADFGRQVPLCDGVLSLCDKLSVTPIAYSPLIKGYYGNRNKALAEQYVSFENEERIARLDSTAKELGVSPTQLVYAYLLKGEIPIIPIVAASNSAQFSEAVGALRIELSADITEKLGK